MKRRVLPCIQKHTNRIPPSREQCATTYVRTHFEKQDPTGSHTLLTSYGDGTLCFFFGTGSRVHLAVTVAPLCRRRQRRLKYSFCEIASLVETNIGKFIKKGTQPRYGWLKHRVRLLGESE